MPAPDGPLPTSLGRHSPEQLQSLLRSASNCIEMLLNPDAPHHDDDVERLRIRQMNAIERSHLQREALTAVRNIRAEFMRRETAASSASK